MKRLLATAYLAADWALIGVMLFLGTLLLIVATGIYTIFAVSGLLLLFLQMAFGFAMGTHR